MKNENFNCKKCGKEIDKHNKYLHDGMCDDCFFDEYFPEEFVMLPTLFIETKKNIKSIFDKEDLYTVFLNVIESNIAYGYIENKKLTDNDVKESLKYIKINYDKPIGFFKKRFEKEFMYGLSEALQVKQISKHELMLVIDYILWAIDNRFWMQDKQAYVKWISYRLETMEDEEMRNYALNIEKLGNKLGMSKKEIDIILEKEINIPKIDSDFAKISSEFFSMQKQEKERFLLEKGTFYYELFIEYMQELYNNKDNDYIKKFIEKIIIKNPDFLPYYITASEFYNNIGNKLLAKHLLETALNRLDESDTSNELKEKMREELNDFIKQIMYKE